jgi:hypothetical protein
MFCIRSGILVVGVFCSAAVAGCNLQEPYQFAHGWQATPESTNAAMIDMNRSSSSLVPEPQICEGAPNKFVDGVGWVLGIPGKIMLFDSRVDNHAVTPETTGAVADYLKQNQMTDVCVRVNQYAPGDEWRRLCENWHVGAGWRYTMGTWSLIGYTLIPGRLTGGDRYNPYTNSVYVYSDLPSLAIKAAAYAKDVHQRDLPGTYVAVNHLPVVSLWHETVNTKDALGYIRTQGSVAQQAEAQRILYPSYCIAVGGAFGGFPGVQPIMIAAGAVTGHVSGRLQSQTPPSAQSDAPLEQASLLPDVQRNDNQPPDRGTPFSEIQRTSGPFPAK